MSAQPLAGVRAWMRQVSGEKGIADILLIAMFAFILGVLVTGHRIVVQ